MNRLAVFRALLVIASVGSTPAIALAQQQQYGQTSPDTYVTWGTNTPQANIDVTYFIGAGFNATQANLIRQAAATWNNAGSALNLVEVGVLAGSNIQMDFVPIGAPVFSQMTLNSVPGPGTYPNGDPWRQIVSPATLNVNSNFNWWDGTGVQPVNAFDLEAYVTTLLGRGLGLGNAAPGDAASVMQPDSAFLFGAPGNTALSPGDIVAVNAVYGTPEPATFALFGIGLAAFGFSKRVRRR